VLNPVGAFGAGSTESVALPCLVRDVNVVVTLPCPPVNCTGEVPIVPIVGSEMLTLTFTVIPPATGWRAEGFPDESSIADTTVRLFTCCSPIATGVAEEPFGPEKMNPEGASVTAFAQVPKADPVFAE